MSPARRGPGSLDWPDSGTKALGVAGSSQFALRDDALDRQSVGSQCVHLFFTSSSSFIAGPMVEPWTMAI